jgi:AraC-like DNA-binding protein
MVDSDRERRAVPPARGILRGGRPVGAMLADRVLPCPALAPVVHHFWVVQWNLRTPFTAEALPHPAARLTVALRSGAHRTEISGVRTLRFSHRLTGTGRVFGIAFRPAVFQQLLGAPMSTLTDRAVPIGSVLGPEGEALARQIRKATGFPQTVSIAEAFLAQRIPSLAPEAARVRDLVERLMSDRSLLRVEDVAEAFGVDVRLLQRVFRKYVGVSPKWVIRRYRLHEAAERLKDPRPAALAELATLLGYADQAHFAREFKQVIGRTPRDFQTLWQTPDAAPRRRAESPPRA